MSNERAWFVALLVLCALVVIGFKVLAFLFFCWLLWQIIKAVK